MGLFFKKKKDPYEDMDLDLNENNFGKASDRIIMERMTYDDTHAKELLDSLKNGSPLVLNFDGMNLQQADKYMAFFQGAAAALDGRAVRINESTFLYARKEEFLDGSLKEFVDGLPKEN
ncbi:cell division inhibitor SepF [Anaeroplasma bactoclasticum]|jgi:cell division inhibitor SepF|uniref:Cell division inhibitor SepF n=1 Tax=Anaeroplasma bactoclasticum TaxID=2088 RepID=A0A397RSS2_9MOLU|nr:cell division protein SepF [Anaeroplasma bactoclasticum]RIA75479.1 cell division inhibitor SepF [Anaeroplasma bactoclasticum]